MLVVGKTAMSYIFWRVDLPLVLLVINITILVADIVIIDIRYDFYILYCKLVFWGEVLWDPARDYWSRGTLDDAIQLVSLPQNTRQYHTGSI